MNRLPDEMTHYPPGEAIGTRAMSLYDTCEGPRRSGEFALDTSGNPRRRGRLFNIDRETYNVWRAMGGNAKARRRWRRRNRPNSQQPTSKMAAQSMAAWSALDDGMDRAIGEWQAHALTFDAGVAPPINAGVTLRYGDRVVNVTGQTNEEMAQTAARLINGEEA